MRKEWPKIRAESFSYPLLRLFWGVGVLLNLEWRTVLSIDVSVPRSEPCCAGYLRGDGARCQDLLSLPLVTVIVYFDYKNINLCYKNIYIFHMMSWEKGWLCNAKMNYQ